MSNLTPGPDHRGGSMTVPALAVTSVFKDFAPSLLPFAITILGGLQIVLDNPGNWQVILTFAILVVGNVASFGLRLLPSGWHGALKTGANIIVVILTALAPFVLPGGIDTSVSLIFIVIAILNALSTEFGSQIRMSRPEVIDSRGTPEGEIQVATRLIN